MKSERRTRTFPHDGYSTATARGVPYPGADLPVQRALVMVSAVARRRQALLDLVSITSSLHACKKAHL